MKFIVHDVIRFADRAQIVLYSRDDNQTTFTSFRPERMSEIILRLPHWKLAEYAVGQEYEVTMKLAEE